ncbi:MAG TPA: cytochrome c biogenesis protein ResB [Dissulfurispiraceae bacterium]|nr:cytochrome c biogenesis protein ResB [Dissulfurispiraceae bacterium]
MESREKKKGIVENIWGLFSSVKLAVIVFSVISATSVIGTILEQQAEPARNIKLLAKFFGDSAAPSVFGVLDSMGFTDMFSSWWFMGLLFIFAANLIVCSIERLPRIWKIVREPIKPLNEERLNTATHKREITLRGKADRAQQKSLEGLKKIGLRGSLRKDGDAAQICAERGRYSRLGVYVTHLSILLILIGAVVGMKFGFNGHLNLLEGTSSAVAFKGNGQEIPLGFEIRCDNFEVSFYPDSESPKSYKSELVVLEQGREVMKQEIEVNTPLRYKGITFYQSSYGFSPNRNALFKLAVTPTNGKAQEISIRFGQPFAIEGTSLTGTVVDFSPALAVDNSGKLFTFAESMINPAVFVEVSDAGKPVFRQWLLKRYPDSWKTPLGTMEFKNLWGVQYTGLQVRKDPGVWIVYLGCIVMAIGLYAAFFMNHARIWIGIREEKNNTRLVIVSNINKNRIAFEQNIDKLVKHLEEKA